MGPSPSLPCLPGWQGAAHLCFLQPSALPHTCSQDGHVPSQHYGHYKQQRRGGGRGGGGSRGEVGSKETGQNGHFYTKKFHTPVSVTFLLHWWMPHCFNLVHFVSQRYSVLHGSDLVFFRQRHRLTAVCMHWGHTHTHL